MCVECSSYHLPLLLRPAPSLLLLLLSCKCVACAAVAALCTRRANQFHSYSNAQPDAHTHTHTLTPPTLSLPFSLATVAHRCSLGHALLTRSLASARGSAAAEAEAEEGLPYSRPNNLCLLLPQTHFPRLLSLSLSLLAPSSNTSCFAIAQRFELKVV